MTAAGAGTGPARKSATQGRANVDMKIIAPGSMLRRLADLWVSRRTFGGIGPAAGTGSLKPATIVTGASRGIGAALAESFARNGADVVLVARSVEPLEAVAAGIRARTGRNAIALAQDVTEDGAAQALQAKVEAAGYYIDVLVNNAGIGLAGPFHEHDAARIDQLLDLNIKAMTRLTRHFLPAMLVRRRGGVLNAASLGGAVPGPYQAAYYASKAYVLSFTEAIGAETAGQGVRISAFAPGPAETEFHAAMGAERALYRVAMPALTPERAARAAHFGFLTGKRVIVPGVLNTLLYACVRVLPHTVTIPLVKALLALRKKI